MIAQMRLLFCLAVLAAVSSLALADDWGQTPAISSTMGVNGNRLCVGEASRGDLGCPTYAPSMTTAGDVSVTGNLSAAKFIGDGSGLTGLAAANVSVTTGLSGSIIYRDAYGSLTANNTFSISSTNGSVGIGAAAGAALGSNALYANGSIQTANNFYGNNLYINGAGGVLWGSTNNAITGDATNKYLAFTTSNTEALRIVSTGYVGIGTSAPLNMLDVVAARSGGDLVRLQNTHVSGYSGISFYDNSGAMGGSVLFANSGAGINPNSMMIGPRTAAAPLIFTAGAGLQERMRLDVNGNLGIGTSAPSATLHVAGTGAFTNKVTVGGLSVIDAGVTNPILSAYGNIAVQGGSTVYYGGGVRAYCNNLGCSANQNSNMAFTLTNTGGYQFGVSTSTPSTTLHVGGTIRMADGGESCDANRLGAIKYTTNAFYICKNTSNGWEALATGIAGVSTFASLTDVSYSGAGGNIFGPGSLTGATSTTSNSTAFGYQALSSASNSGNQNSAFGNQALKSITTGTQNAAFGYRTLLTNTTGSTNAAFGSEALYSNSTGSNNTAVGRTSMQYNSTGILNTAIGASALRYNTSGNNNVAIGYVAGQYSTGTANISIGDSSAYFATGNFNTVIGTQAGLGVSNTSTYTNTTLLGAYAGNGLTSGNNNTLIGYNAGAGITTGANNIVLGYNLSPYSNTGSNQLNLGNALYGDLGGGSTLRAKLGVNVTSPTASLEVSGTISATIIRLSDSPPDACTAATVGSIKVINGRTYTCRM